MVGYVSAFTAVFCGAVKGFCGKQISAYTERLSSAAYLNYLRMLLCIGIGAVLVFMKDGAAGFLCSYNSKMKCRMEGRDVMNLMLVGMANGLVGFSQKLFVYHSDGHSIAVFNFYTYIFSALVLWFFFRLSKLWGFVLIL